MKSLNIGIRILYWILSPLPELYQNELSLSVEELCVE